MYDLVITTGAFNLIHPGHLKFLKSAAKMGNKLAVFLDSDERNENLKKEKAIFSFSERKDILLSLPFVWNVYEYHGPTKGFGFVGGHRSFQYYLSEFEKGSNLFVKGADYTMDTLDQDQLSLLKKYNYTICFLEYDKRYSTTRMIDDLIGKRLVNYEKR